MACWNGPLWADQILFLVLNRARHPLLDALMPLFSDFGIIAPWVGLLLVWRLWRGGREERIIWLTLVLAVAASDMVCAKMLKPLAGRLRPDKCLDGVYLLRDQRWVITDPSFREGLVASLGWPSCHAANIWTVTGYLAPFRPRLSLALALIAMGVCYSRIYLGVHYPLDVLTGVLIGGLWGLAVGVAVRRWLQGQRRIFS